MGKTADNERIKLKATFFNNIAVGCVVGGATIPYIAFFQKLQNEHVPIFSADPQLIWSTVGSIGLASILAFFFRLEANSQLKRLTD